ncbi:MAG: hypothetical protein JJT78_06605 [Leptospira sp.]|nr:hypothetical protein [Leptospira sp.]
MKNKMRFSISKKGVARFLFFLLISIFISPLLGIHIHHEVDFNGNKSVIHSYFFEDHDTHHPPVSSQPESLPEHISSGGVSVDMGSWDMGLVISNVETIRLTYVLMISLLLTIFLSNSVLLLIQELAHSFQIKLFNFSQILNVPIQFNNCYVVDFSFFYLPPPSFNK